MNNIELHIEKLVLHGFPPSDRQRIGEAVELGLTRLFTEQGISYSMSKGGEFPHLDGGKFNLAPNSKTDTIGAKVAQSVYKNMSALQSRKDF